MISSDSHVPNCYFYSLHSAALVAFLFLSCFNLTSYALHFVTALMLPLTPLLTPINPLVPGWCRCHCAAPGRALQTTYTAVLSQPGAGRTTGQGWTFGPWEKHMGGEGKWLIPLCHTTLFGLIHAHHDVSSRQITQRGCDIMPHAERM